MSIIVVLKLVRWLIQIVNLIIKYLLHSTCTLIKYILLPPWQKGVMFVVALISVSVCLSLHLWTTLLKKL